MVRCWALNATTGLRSDFRKQRSVSEVFALSSRFLSEWAVSSGWSFDPVYALLQMTISGNGSATLLGLPCVSYPAAELMSSHGLHKNH